MKRPSWPRPHSGCSAPHAQSSVTLYGLIDAGITYSNKVATTGGHDKLVKYGDGVASGSRWGIRGTEDLGGGLKALFVLENGFSSGDGSIGAARSSAGRHSSACRRTVSAR